MPGGRHALRAGYFLALIPGGGSWVRAGRFTPTPPELAAIRQEIHYDSAGFHRVIEAPQTLRHFPDRPDLRAPQLTRPPRGYEASDPDLPFLKLKSFGLNSYFADAKVLAPDFIDQVVARMLAARPWVAFLNQALAEYYAKKPIGLRDSQSNRLFLLLPKD